MATSDYYTYGTNLRNKEFFTSTVNNNNKKKRYFSNIDAEIYFGNEDITHELCEFSFTVEEKKFPVYSYNKFYPDIIIPGQRIVQGSFAVNFTEGAFMRELLSKIDDSILNLSYFDEELYNPGGDARNSALWNKNFDITIGYGDYKSDNPSYGSTCQMICGVQIVNKGKAISGKTGEPILEVYSFIGKDFIDKEIDEYISDNDSNNNNDSNINNENPSTKHVIEYSALFHPDSMSYLTVSLSTNDINVDLDSISENADIEILDRNITSKLSNDILKNVRLVKHASYKYYIANSVSNTKLFDIIKDFFKDNPTDSIKCNIKHKMKIKDKEQDLSADIYIRLGKPLIN